MFLNTNIRLELGMNEIKSSIQKSTLRWFGRVMRMREKRIPQKKATHKNGGKATNTQNQMDMPN